MHFWAILVSYLLEGVAGSVFAVLLGNLGLAIDRHSWVLTCGAAAHFAVVGSIYVATRWTRKEGLIVEIIATVIVVVAAGILGGMVAISRSRGR